MLGLNMCWLCRATVCFWVLRIKISVPIVHDSQGQLCMWLDMIYFVLEEWIKTIYFEGGSPEAFKMPQRLLVFGETLRKLEWILFIWSSVVVQKTRILHLWENPCAPISLGFIMVTSRSESLCGHVSKRFVPYSSWFRNILLWIH